jgi:signal transduction histidine kinase/FixJ family two-component response regulator
MLIANTSGWSALLIGLFGITGWILGSEQLKSAFSDATMKPNAAVALCFSALALLGMMPRHRNALQRRAAFVLSALVVAIGGATLLQHIGGWNFGIDQLLFYEPPGQIATSSPGRMGPPASASFVLLGTGLMLFDRRSTRRTAASQWIALCALPLPLLAITGYAVNATLLYGIARITGIALHTAIGILLVALGLLLARAERSPVALLIMDNPGGEVARTMLPAAVLLPIAFGWLRGEVQRLGFLDPDLGRALIIVCLSGVFTVMVWRLARRLSAVAQARYAAELSSSHAQAVARRLAAENTQTLGLLEALLAHAPVGLMFINRLRQCVRLNEFLARAIADGQHGAVGRRLEDVLGGPHRELESAIERALVTGDSTMNVELRLAGGTVAERRWLAGVFAVPECVEGAELCGAVLMDITRMKVLESQTAALLDSERAARLDAERAAALKDQFLATLSHELRTPLNAILGWVHLARQMPHATDLERPLGIIERNARAQTQLIEDLLDVSRIVSGKMRLSKQMLDLSAVAKAALAAAAPAAAAKSIVVEFKAESNLPSIFGDAARIQQAISNLLSNAVKFTAANGRIELTLRRRDDHLDVVVRDDGIGIEPEFLPHVFDRFRQADASTTRRHGGLGLGLAIVKQLAELHGGSVGVSSAGAQAGTRFTLSLPIAAQVDDATDPASAPEPMPTSIVLSGTRIIVVDDEADAREFLGRVLADAHAKVLLAANVDEALALLGHEQHCILVSDIGMPGRDGYDLIEAVRARYDAKQVPAIAVTAFARGEDRDRAIDAGFQVHLTKPVEPYELTMAVARLLASTRYDLAEGPRGASSVLEQQTQRAR